MQVVLVRLAEGKASTAVGGRGAGRETTLGAKKVTGPDVYNVTHDFGLQRPLCSPLAPRKPPG